MRESKRERQRREEDQEAGGEILVRTAKRRRRSEYNNKRGGKTEKACACAYACVLFAKQWKKRDGMLAKNLFV